MSVVVRMEMPEGCLDCPCANGEYGYCQADKEERQIGGPNERPSWCPIICYLPEGHGRLIDADALPKYTGYALSAVEVAKAVENAPTISAPRWHRVEDNPPKPGCYLTASPFFHGDDYSWLYRLAWWTEHGLMDFAQDAEKESGWYIWNNSQDRETEIEPMCWMPIEPPKEDA